ncbi:MAG: GtrA family protein [Candidatus Gracilibacteria bacterium]|nr:GtrA family protein [Candidatus Gracilibacteria bacterium]
MNLRAVLKDREVFAQMLRYFLIAVIIVFLEMWAFIWLNENLEMHYIPAIVISFVFATILNWYACRKFVFKQSRLGTQKELLLIFIGSLVGVGIQIGTTVFCVEILLLIPWIGKLASMGLTFVWNFFFRKIFVFK